MLSRPSQQKSGSIMTLQASIQNTADISRQLSELSALARQAHWRDEIIITPQHSIITHNGSQLWWPVQRIVTAMTHVIESLLSTFLCHTIVLIDHSKKREDLTSTVNQLKAIFGKQRVDRNIAWCGISMKTLHDNGLCLSKQDFATLFHSFALTTKPDIEELLAELHGDTLYVRGVDGERLDALRRQFHGKTEIDSCSPEEITTLEKILLPFADPKDLFWISQKERVNDVTFPVTTFDMIADVAWALHVLKTRHLPLKDWEALFGKRLAQPQLPAHLIVPHPNNGYLCFSHVVENGGASKRFFRSLHPQQNVPPIILYRGTRGPMPGDGISDTFSSLLEDLRHELGSSGPIATYEETKELLEYSEKGFVTSPDQKVALITNSIGGAQGQRDALCFHNRVLSLTTNSSPGIDAETATLFRNVMSLPRETPMIITHNIDKGDVVDTLGDEHIGGKCTNAILTFRSLSPATPDTEWKNSSWTVTNRLNDFLFSGIFSLFSNIAGIFSAHVRSTTEGLYKEEVISSEDPATRDIADAYAQHQSPYFDRSWEQIRRFFCPAPSPGFADFARQHLGTVTK
jgi:hypothetical protein